MHCLKGIEIDRDAEAVVACLGDGGFDFFVAEANEVGSLDEFIELNQEAIDAFVNLRGVGRRAGLDFMVGIEFGVVLLEPFEAIAIVEVNDNIKQVQQSLRLGFGAKFLGDAIDERLDQFALGKGQKAVAIPSARSEVTGRFGGAKYFGRRLNQRGKFVGNGAEVREVRIVTANAIEIAGANRQLGGREAGSKPHLRSGLFLEHLGVEFCILGEDELRLESARFDELWERSRVALPTARAAHVLHWQAKFGDQRQPLRTVVVEHEGKWVAALAMAPGKIGPLSAGRLPTNPWQPSGELLLDEESDCDRAIDSLIEGMLSLKLSLFDFGIILPGTKRWHSFFAGLKRRSLVHSIAPRFEVGLVDCARDWQAQGSSWSPNHRRRVKRNQKMLDSRELSVEFLPIGESGQNLALLEILWRLEAKSWKGEVGGAVEHQPVLVEFYRNQAMLLAEAKSDDVSANVAILRREGEPIAAIYYWLAKGVCHLWKTAYDPASSEISPGSLLLQEVLRTQIESGDCRLFNLMGEISAAHASWATRKFEVGRLLFHGDSGIGRAAVEGYRAIRRLRGRPEWRAGEMSEPWPRELTANAPLEFADCR